MFSEAINNLPKTFTRHSKAVKAEQAAVQRRDYDPKIKKKEGGIYVADDGVLMQVNNGQGTPLTKKKNSKHELVDLSPKEKSGSRIMWGCEMRLNRRNMTNCKITLTGNSL